MERLADRREPIASLAVFPTIVGILACVALLLICMPAYAFKNGHPVVVSLGDSYSSGEGTEPFYYQEQDDKFHEDDWLAHRSELAWPGQLKVKGELLKPLKDKYWYFVASSGAKIGHIMGTDVDGDKNGEQKKSWSRWTSPFTQEGDSKYLKCQSKIFTKLSKKDLDIDCVTLTIGGNDLGFADIVTVAALEDSAFLSTGALNLRLLAAVEQFEDTTKGDLLKLYDYVHKRAGHKSKLVVAGYPRLFPTSGRDGVISATEAMLINAAVDTFDTEMGGAIATSGKDWLRFADVRGEFVTHEYQFINGIIMGAQEQDLEAFQITSAYSVHPSKAGQRAYARVVQRVINDLQLNESTAPSTVPSTPSSSASGDANVDIASDVAMSLVFDVSGSMDEMSAMSGMSKLDSAKKQSCDFVSSVAGHESGVGGLSVRVGIVAFADSAQTVCGLSNDSESVNESISSLSADGQTNMYDGLNRGIEQLLHEDGPRVMVLLSDGLSNMGGSREEIIDLAHVAADNSIAVYTIGFGPSGSLDEELLQEIADITGGSYSHEDSADISAAAVGLFATMMNVHLQANNRLVASTTGTVQQDEVVQAGDFDIAKNGTVQVYLYWPGSILDMKLTDPEGTLVDNGYPGYTVDTSKIPTEITVANAKRGTWTMAVYGREVSMVEEPYYAAAAFEETTEPAPTGGGGGASNSGEGLMLLILIVGVATAIGVLVYSSKRGARSDHSTT